MCVFACRAFDEESPRNFRPPPRNGNACIRNLRKDDLSPPIGSDLGTRDSCGPISGSHDFASHPIGSTIRSELGSLLVASASRGHTHLWERNGLHGGVVVLFAKILF
jgi:hypothetical protein